MSPARAAAGARWRAAAGARWRAAVVLVLALAVAAVVALLLAQSAGALHIPLLGSGGGPVTPRPPARPAGG